MYIIEGWDLKPEFWGFVTDGQLVEPPALPSKKIEFIGNSITCGYGNEAMLPTNHYSYETQNHYLSYAQIAARQLDAVAYIVARSGIGVYRNYNGPRTGTPDNRIDVQYEYTMYAEKSAFRREGGAMVERWDFSRFQPDVVCINLGTNDLSANNYGTTLLKQGYKKLLRMVRQHNPQAKIVWLTGTMLQKKELDICRRLLDEVADEAHRSGDQQVYRFDMTPQGSLGYGADWHPSYEQHKKMADELTAFLRKIMD
jgi:lysophospholipase L1-like esterase